MSPSIIESNTGVTKSKMRCASDSPVALMIALCLIVSGTRAQADRADANRAQATRAQTNQLQATRAQTNQVQANRPQANRPQADRMQPDRARENTLQQAGAQATKADNKTATRSKKFAGVIDFFTDLTNDKSFEDMNAAIKKNPQDSMNYVYRGFAYWMDGDATKAMQDYDKALSLDAKNAKAHVGKSRAYQGLGKTALAFNELKLAASVGTSEEAHLALFESAFLHRELRQYDAAIQQYDIVMKTPFKDKARTAYARFQRGECYFRMNKLTPALVDLNDSLKIDPEIPSARRILASLYMRVDRPEDALREYDRVIEKERKETMDLGTDLPDLYRERAAVYKRLGRTMMQKRDLGLAEKTRSSTYDLAPFRFK